MFPTRNATESKDLRHPHVTDAPLDDLMLRGSIYHDKLCKTLQRGHRQTSYFHGVELGKKKTISKKPIHYIYIKSQKVCEIEFDFYKWGIYWFPHHLAVEIEIPCHLVAKSEAFFNDFVVNKIVKKEI